MSVLSRYPALGFALYRRYWLASLGSVGGWQIANMAMGWLVFELSGSALHLGILGAATAVPAIVLTVAGGVIADRFDKRQVLMWTTALNTLLLLLLASLVLTGVVAVWHIWAVAAAISMVSGIDWPVRQSFFPYLIDKSALLSAVALNSVLWQSTRMVLPAVGGVLLALYDPSLAFFIAAAGYALMLMVVRGIRIAMPGQATSSPLQQTLEGLRFIAGHPFFRHLILLSYVTMFFLSSYMQLMPAFASLLDAGPTGFGMLMSATGVGSIMGTVLAGSLRAGDYYGRILLAAAYVSAVLLFSFALVSTLPSYALALIFALLAASSTSVFLILSTTALQAEVPDAMRGRVMGIHGITYSLMPLGAMLTGALAQPLGTAQGLMLSLLIYLVLLALITSRARSVRTLAAPQSPEAHSS